MTTTAQNKNIVNEESSAWQTLTSETKNGELDGELKEWYRNGQLASLVYWKNGKWHGEWKRWYENGQVKWHCSYKDGKKDGEWTKWYLNGQLEYQGCYKNEVLDGEWKMWHQSGQLKYSKLYCDGILCPPNLVQIQRIIRTRMKLRRFVRLCQSRVFCEWFWAPNRMGGC